MPRPQEPARFIQAEIGQKTYLLEVANTPQKRWSGLSNRPKLAEDHGMLFVFPQAVHVDFCMAGMKFPLDIIWLRNGRVIELTENFPCSGRKAELPIRSNERFDRVIELNAGEIKSSGLKVGDRPSFR